MNNKEKNIILKNYKRIYNTHKIIGIDKNDSIKEYKALLDELGMKKDRYIIENEVISEKNNYNSIQIDMFNMIFESFLKYGVYIHYDIQEIEEIYDNLQFSMNDKENKLYHSRINNILQYM